MIQKDLSEFYTSLDLDQLGPVDTVTCARPVDEWSPPNGGPIDMVIKRDGSWHYQGTRIKRARMVRLFASILRHEEDDHYYLVTPIEKHEILVEDAPFVAVLIAVEGGGSDQELIFTTSLGDRASAGREHPLRFVEDEKNGFKPYIHIRGRLEALISRSLVYDLVVLAETGSDCGQLGVWSGGVFFPMDGLEK